MDYKDNFQSRHKFKFKKNAINLLTNFKDRIFYTFSGADQSSHTNLHRQTIITQIYIVNITEHHLSHVSI